MTSPTVPNFVDEEDPDEEQNAMMAEMGFATFGSKGKGPKAKRVKLRQDGDVEVGTGGNNIPLGRGRRGGGGGDSSGGGGGAAAAAAAAATAGDGEGVVLGRVEDVEDVDDNGDGRMGGVRLSHEVVGSKDEEPYEGPRYDQDGDEDMPVRSEMLNPQRSTINTLPLKPPSTLNPTMGAQGTGSGGGWGQGQRRTDGKREDGSWDWQALRKGVRDEQGDMAYYDGSFVEDPWRALRGEMR